MSQFKIKVNYYYDSYLSKACSYNGPYYNDEQVNRVFDMIDKGFPWGTEFEFVQTNFGMFARFEMLDKIAFPVDEKFGWWFVYYDRVQNIVHGDLVFIVLPGYTFA